MKHYAIAGGAEGKSRLKILAKAMQPYTQTFLQHLGITLGMSCLDLGCGGGDVTFELAKLVGETGRVVGIELDETVVELTRQDFQQLGLTNVEFKVADALTLNEEDSYDVAYTRFLLTHLDRPQRIIEKMRTAIKPNGSIAIEDIQFSGHFCHPDCPAFDRYLQLYQKVVIDKGGDPEIGAKLPGMLCHAGFKSIDVNIVQPTFMAGEGKLLAQITMEKISRAVLKGGLASEEEIDKIVAQLQEFAQNPESIISLPRIFQVSGCK